VVTHPGTSSQPGTAAPPPLPKRPVPAWHPERPAQSHTVHTGHTGHATATASRTATRPAGAVPVAPGPVAPGPGQGAPPAETVPPEEVVLDEELEELEEDLGKRRLPRRALLQAALIGGAGIAALPLLAVISRLTKSGPKPLALTYPLNDGWLFGGEYQPGTEATGYDDTSFAPVTIPHCVTTLSWRNWNPHIWQNIWIYRRHIDSDQLPGIAAKTNRVFAHFDGVMVNSTVIFNDQVIGTHQGGYLPFQVELTGHVKHGTNVLSVAVDSRAVAVPPMVSGTWAGNYDFLQPGGIYRDVNLRVVPQVYVSDVYAAPADVLSAQPRLDVQVTIDAAVKSRHPATLQVDLLDATDGSRVATATKTITIDQPGVTTTALTMTGLGGIKLWSVTSPNLYTVQATVTVPGVGAHLATTRTGFRDARFRPDGFYLNGKRLQIFGLDRHQLFPYTGMAMPARAQRKDAQLIKTEFNCNMVRCSHYPQSPHFLDACDELGLLVWEEAPGWDHVSHAREWQDLVIQNVRDMVTRDRSRPSVIVWGTRLNETHKYPALWAATRQAAAELDPARPSSGAMDDRNMDDWAEDVFGFNDYSFSKVTGNAELQPPVPGVPYLITESVGVVEAQPEHFTWTDPPALLAKQGALHAQVHSLAAAEPAYAGLIAWAAFDYGSLQGRPDTIKWAGVADTFRVPKPAAAIYQAQVDPAKQPVIIPMFFWDQQGANPGPAAMIASNCEQLTIFINGNRVATALPAADSPLYNRLTYPPFLVTLPGLLIGDQPEELLIQGYVGGQRVAEAKMSANPAGDHLAIAVDDNEIDADGSDVTRVVFRAVDSYGNLIRTGNGLVTLTISGPGVIVGDNPFEFGAYGGLGAVWVRSVSGQPGTITVTAAHPVLGSAHVSVQSQ